jgi:hypothetical protein
MKKGVLAVMLGVGLHSALPLGAGEVPGSEDPWLASWTERQALAAGSPFRALQWRNVGPSVMSARVIDIEVSPGDKYTLYLVGATSGIWKSVNNGNTWTPLFDDQPDYSL